MPTSSALKHPSNQNSTCMTPRGLGIYVRNYFSTAGAFARCWLSQQRHPLIQAGYPGWFAAEVSGTEGPGVMLLVTQDLLAWSTAENSCSSSGVLCQISTCPARSTLSHGVEKCSFYSSNHLCRVVNVAFKSRTKAVYLKVTKFCPCLNNIPRAHLRYSTVQCKGVKSQFTLGFVMLVVVSLWKIPIL